MNIAAYIDHTYLKPQGTDKEISALCSEAKEYGFYSVCVNPCWIPLCRELLTGSSVKIAAVVGFPLGAMSTESKAFEVQQAKKAGADEIDMVINIGFLKAGMYDEVLNDIKAVVLACRPEVLLKVIIENCLLTDDEKIRACETAVKAWAHFVKTSTGFNGEGATVQDVALMRKTVGPDIGVKAAGGVRTYEDAVEMIEAGATRIGTSGGVQIIQGRPHTDGY